MTYESLFIGLVTIGVISGLTPNLLSVFLSLIAGSLGRGSSTKRIVVNGTLFALGFIITATVAGYAWLQVLENLSFKNTQLVTIVLALCVTGAGLLEIKDYFWYGRGISHKPHKKLSRLAHTHSIKKYGALNAIFLGIIALASSVTTVGLLLLASSSVIFLSKPENPVWWIGFYALSVLCSVLCILFLVSRGTRVSAVLKWKEDSKPLMRLSSGLAAIALAWLLLLMINTTLVVEL
jgi:uncharacterized membrane protein YqaE (UPF0057 family)